MVEIKSIYIIYFLGIPIIKKVWYDAKEKNTELGFKQDDKKKKQKD